MMIELRLFAIYRKYLPPGSKAGKCDFKVSEGATVKDVIETLGLPEKGPFIIFVNQERTERDHPLGDGDQLSIFPPLGGGGLL